MEMQTATGLGEKKFLGQIVPDNFSEKAAYKAYRCTVDIKFLKSFVDRYLNAVKTSINNLK